MESMVKQLEAHLHEEPKLWSFIVLYHKQIMNARRESKERNLTWRIQENRNCWTLLEHLMESISSILYVFLKFGKLAIQRFKQCMNQSWNEEVMAIGSQSHQAEGQFRRLQNQPLAAKSQEDGCEISLGLRNPPECFQIFSTDTFRFFSSDIWCLNPHFLLVIHQS